MAKAAKQLSPIERARARLETMQKDKEKRGKGGGGTNNFVQLESGKNIVHVCAGKSEDDDFMVETAQHFNVGPNKKVCLCRKFIGKKCPLCIKADEHTTKAYKLKKRYEAGGERDGKLKKEMEAEFRRAREFKPRKKFYFNVIPLQLGKKTYEGKEVKILGCPSSVAEGILAFATDLDEYGTILDLKSGRDIIIQKSGQDLDTNYKVSLRDKDRSTKLHSNRLKELHDLSALVGSYPSYEDVMALLNGEEPKSKDDDEDEEDDEEEKATAKRKGKPKRFKKDEDDEEEDDSDDEDESEDEEDEDEEDEKPAKKGKTKKKSSKDDDDEDEDEEDDEDEEEDSDDDDEESEDEDEDDGDDEDEEDEEEDDEDEDDDEDEEEEKPVKKKSSSKKSNLKSKLKKTAGRK